MSTEKHIVENGRQLIPLADVADLEPGALLDTSSSPLLRVPLEVVLSDTPAPTPLPCDAGAHHFTVPSPIADLSMDADQPLPPPQCLDPFVHHLRDQLSIARVLEVLNRLWLLLFASLQDFGSSEQLSRHASALLHQSSDRQTSGHGFGQIPRHGPHPILHITMGETSCCHPGEIRCHPILVNHKKLNKLSILGQLPIPEVEVLDKLGTGRIFSLFDLVSSFHQISVHKDTIPLVAFCTPTRIFE